MHIRVKYHSVIFNKLPGYSIFYHERRLPTFCCLIFDNHSQLRMHVTTFNPYRCGGACDSVPSVIMTHLDEYKLLSKRQHAFREKHSCETQLIAVIKDWAKILDHGGQVSTFILDFEMAFDTGLHELLKCKLRGLSQNIVDKCIFSRMRRNKQMKFSTFMKQSFSTLVMRVS